MLQASYLLANLSNGTPIHQSHILNSPRILAGLQTCLGLVGGSKTKMLCKPIVGCLLELAHSDEKGRKVIVEAVFVGI